jgi:hypothetical protein
MLVGGVAFAVFVTALAHTQEETKEAKIESAMAGGPPEIGKNARIVEFGERGDFKTLREGSNGLLLALCIAMTGSFRTCGPKFPAVGPLTFNLFTGCAINRIAEFQKLRVFQSHTVGVALTGDAKHPWALPYSESHEAFGGA